MRDDLRILSEKYVLLRENGVDPFQHKGYGSEDQSPEQKHMSDYMIIIQDIGGCWKALQTVKGKLTPEDLIKLKAINSELVNIIQEAGKRPPTIYDQFHSPE